MASITSWNRLEPLPSTGDLEPGLEARIADPLWLLARQWQVLEFAGEDAGTPIVAHLTARESTLSGAVLGADGDVAVAVDDRDRPLETLIEAEPLDLAHHERLRVETGSHLLRMLRSVAGAGDAFLAAYRFTPAHGTVGRHGAAFRTVAAGRAPDGLAVAEALRSRLDGTGSLASLPPEVDLPAGAANVATAIAAEWLAWFDGLVTSGVGAAWDRSRLEYAAAVAARTDDGTEVLSIDEFSDGHLDWYAFDRGRRDAGAVPEPGGSEPATITRTVIPVPASYAGMPANRFWEFENGRVNFGAVDAGPTDITRLALAEFALAYGTDWFVVPVDLRCGSLCSIVDLRVVDTFGETTAIPAITTGDGWAMFEFGRRGDGQPSRLLLPPVLADSVSGDPIESVAFVRDEMANMAWAVERTVTGPTGDVIDRTETPTDPAVGWHHVGDATPDGMSAYRLATPVPDHWIPLVPVRTSPDDAAVVLEKRTIRRTTQDGPVDVEPLGRLLEPGGPLRIAEESVPRAGVTVERAWQLTRWIDGSTHVWIGRRTRAGRGMGHSGLRFDVVDQPM